MDRELNNLGKIQKTARDEETEEKFNEPVSVE